MKQTKTTYDIYNMCVCVFVCVCVCVVMYSMM